MKYTETEIKTILEERSIALGVAMALVMKETNATSMKYSTEISGRREDNKDEKYEVKVTVTVI